MVDMFGEIGFARWPLVFSFAAVLGLASYSATRLFGHGALLRSRLAQLVDPLALCPCATENDVAIPSSGSLTCVNSP